MDIFELDPEFIVGTDFERIVLASSSSIIHWESPEALDESQVGGKNGKLAKMLQGGMPVPPGFAIPSRVFEDRVDTEALTRYALALQFDKAREIASNTPVPDDVLEAYDRYLKKAGKEFIQDSKKNCLVSVRSSAIAEDAGNASFAGQLRSFLYQSRNGGERADDVGIVAAVQGVWASYFSDTAMTYKTSQIKKGNLPPDALGDIRVAVVVQAMLDPDAAGVMFTANPLNLDPQEHLIHAVPGVGENYVNGTHTEDEFVTDKTGKVKRFVGEHGILEPNHIKDLTEYANAAQNTFGSPQDMEWAVKGPKTYILQSRPITTETGGAS